MDNSVQWKTVSFSEDFNISKHIYTSSNVSSKNYGGLRGKFIKVENNLPKLFTTVLFHFYMDNMKNGQQSRKPDFSIIPISECLGLHLHFPGCVQFKFQETQPIKQELNAELQPKLKMLSIKFQLKKLDTSFVCLHFTI